MAQSGKVTKKEAIKNPRKGNKMKVLYFAELKELLNKTQEDMQMTDSMTVENFEQYLFEQYPQINNKKFQIAVNEEFVQKADVIQPNDTVALIPPVSGG